MCRPCTKACIPTDKQSVLSVCDQVVTACLTPASVTANSLPTKCFLRDGPKRQRSLTPILLTWILTAPTADGTGQTSYRPILELMVSFTLDLLRCTWLANDLQMTKIKLSSGCRHLTTVCVTLAYNTLPNLLFVLFVCYSWCFLVNYDVLCIACKCVLPPGVNPIAVDKYINKSWYHGGKISYNSMTIKLRSDVYLLLFLCLVYIEVRIKRSASVCWTTFFVFPVAYYEADWRCLCSRL
jgi:hypothetical protein